jgi:hypothetical protein
MNPHLLYAGIPLAIAALPWFYDKLPRFTAWMLAIAAAMATAAIPVWVAALGAATASKKGALIFLIILGASAFGFYMEGIHRPRQRKPKDGNITTAQKKPGKNHYHRIRTMAVAAVFGTCTVLAYAMGARLLHIVGKTPAVAAQGFGAAAAQIHSGKAAKAIPASQVHQVLVYGLLVFAAFVVILVLAERKKHGKKLISLGSRKRKPVAGSPGRSALPSRGN